MGLSRAKTAVKMIKYHPYTRTLYRKMLKEVHKFFDADARIHLRERFKANAVIKSANLIKWHAIGKKHLKTLKRANSGEVKATEIVLNRAFGRKGKWKRKLMGQVINHPTPRPPSLIPHMPRTAPPVVSEPLKALMKSQLGKKFKNLEPTMPIMAPGKYLDKRREANIKHRHHTKILKSLDPPLPSQFFSELEKKATAVGVTQARRQCHSKSQSQRSRRITPRYMRRRYLNLLKSSPELVEDDEGEYHAAYSALIYRRYPEVEGVFDGVDIKGKLVRKEKQIRQ